MLKIRIGAFETNSSSVHSFYIKEGFEPKRYEVPTVLHAQFNKYGWAYKYFCNSDFLNYVLTAIYYLGPDLRYILEFEEYKKRACEKALPIQKSIETILAPYNIIVEWESLPESLDFYVDHVDRFMPILDELLKKPELFVSMVLCPESYFCTGNDNSGYDEYDVPYVECDDRKGYRNFVKGN